VNNKTTTTVTVSVEDAVEFLIKGFAETWYETGYTQAYNSVHYKHMASEIIERYGLNMSVQDFEKLGIKHAQAYEKYRKAVAKSVKGVLAKQ